MLNSVGAMLAKTTATLEIKIDAAIRQRIGDQYSEASSSFQFTPINTTDGIDALEENLKNELYAKQLVSMNIFDDCRFKTGSRYSIASYDVFAMFFNCKTD